VYNDCKDGDEMKRFRREEHIAKVGVTASQKRIHGEYSTHFHEFYEIEYITEGNGDYVIDGEKYPMEPGMLFFMTPTSFHRVRAQECRGFNVMFSERLCQMELLVSLLERKQGFAMSIPQKDRPLFLALLGELTETREETYLSCLLNAVLGKLVSYGGERGRSRTVTKGVLYLLEHFRENPSLAETAAHVGFTPSYFSAVFKREMGEGFGQYLDRLRFDYARKLLLHTEMSVAQVCRESGFEDYPNFIRRFKTRFGDAPLEWKTKNR